MDYMKTIDPKLFLSLASIALIFSLWEIRRLRRIVMFERQKRTIPMLKFSLDTELSNFYLQNDDSCFAKNITIQDLEVDIETDFKKTLKLQFDPIESINSNQAVQLRFKIFDGKHQVFASDPMGLVPHLEQATFTIHMTYSNIEDTQFQSTIIKNTNGFIVKEVSPLEK